MNYNTQNAKIASITEVLMLGVKLIMQGPLTGGIMSTQKSRLLSTTMKPGLLHLRHGWKTWQINMVKRR